MTTVRPLNEDEVFNEMKKMADEEFNIEKAKIVRQESLNIEAVFERKIKQAEVQKRIAQSNHVNKARLRVLQERQQILDSLFEDTHNNIQTISSDEERYTELMEGLILQGLYTMMEPDVTIRCREADAEIAQFVSERASQKFQETVKQQSNLTVSDDYLPASSAGGVILSGLQGKIVVDNTLEARLEVIKEEMLPQIRYTLFGNSPSRRFFD
ncbi:ATP synthase subunit [Zychaea mexicana]|uniref:ATP synthase subunit n=1 Tax=Zychaea mexicana TaxID=64656 RepID=UPI0022FE1076|nr:ATP synthase subunit [Zychaea mexicana]KAI9495275.1 ATP synthase subunit [Zychaea mexicana]